MKNLSAVKVLSIVTFLFLLTGDRAWADVYGKIRGTVSDSTGAVIAGVKITAINNDTNTTTSVTSASDGSFEFLQLAAPATYNVKAEQPGFRGFETQGIKLSLDQIYVLPIRLEVGAVTQQVTVEANPAQVETTSMQLGTTLSGNMITSIPLNGRNWITLQQTLPGVVAASDRFSTNYATNGNRSQANNFMVNGTDANDLPLNSPQVIPSPDAIAEVSLITNTINPEYGRNGGAILNATTKSGSNQFHGDAFDFFRDTGLNTRNFFSKKSTIFHQHQFGGVIGGPIVKNKAFFFFSYQGTKNRRAQPGQSGTSTVFTKAERSGDFSAGDALVGSAPFPLTGEDGLVYPAGTGYDVLFPTGHIPAVDFNPISSNLLSKFIPLPNSGSNTFQFNPIEVRTTHQYISRVDYTLTDKDTVWGYWLTEPSHSQRTISFFGGDLPGFGDKSVSHTNQETLSWTHTFSGTMVNEARIGYQRLNFIAVTPVTPVLPSSLGFTGINPQNTVGAGVPLITITGGPTLGFSNNGPQPRIDQTYQITDNFSKIIGRHTTKFGISFLFSQVNNPFYGNNNGNFSFAGGGAYSTGSALPDFLLGIPDTYSQGSGGFIDARTKTYYSYAQDQFKFRPNLTITYGVGWEIDTPIHNIQNGGVGVNCFLPGVQSKVFPAAPAGLVFPGDPGCNDSGGPTTKYRHFAPRLGFAYSPGGSGKWSVRGGYGLYFNRTEEELSLQNLGAVPFSVTSSGIGDLNGSPAFAKPFTDIATGQTIANKFPFTPPKPGAPVDFTFFYPLSINVIDPALTVPYSMNYNLTVERQLSSSTVLTASYVGSLGHHLTNAIELNPAGNATGNPICVATPGCNGNNNYFKAPQSFRYPQTSGGALIFASVGQQGTFINSNYNAGQLTLEKKYSRGLSFRATYGYSHSLDGASSFEDLGFTGVRGLDPFNAKANYGDSAFDARHRLAISYDYQIPSRWHSGFAGRLTEGWDVSGVTTFQSGFPLTVGDALSRSYTCNLTFEYYSCWDRPNRLAGPIDTYDARTSSQANSLGGTRPALKPKDHYFFNPNQFGREKPGTLGNAGRNFFHGPGLNNWDFGLHKNTAITESTHLELRFEFFNVFNHTQFNALAVNVNSNSSNFGRILNARPAGIDSRIVQLAMKIIF